MRRLVLLVAALLVAVPASAQAANPVVTAAAKSAKARSSTMRMRAVTTVPGAGSVVATGTGSQRGQSVKMTMRTSVAGVGIGMDVVGLQEGGHFVVYMRSPVFRQQLPAGKSWVRIDLQEQGANLGIDFSSIVSSSQSMAPLWHGLVSTKRLGREVVAGASTTHYRAVVDYRRAGAALPKFADQIAAIERATGVRVGKVNADVWIGGDGFIRQFRTTTPTVVQGVRAKSVQTITYLAYNVPVTIGAPPRSQVVDAPS
jgi:hypothetical protein